jgi:hypothetical protein
MMYSIIADYLDADQNMDWTTRSVGDVDYVWVKHRFFDPNGTGHDMENPVIKVERINDYGNKPKFNMWPIILKANGADDNAPATYISINTHNNCLADHGMPYDTTLQSEFPDELSAFLEARYNNEIKIDYESDIIIDEYSDIQDLSEPRYMSWV